MIANFFKEVQQSHGSNVWRNLRVIIFFAMAYLGIALNSLIDRIFISRDENIGFQAIFSIGMTIPLVLFLFTIISPILSGSKGFSENGPKYNVTTGNLVFLAIFISSIVTIIMEAFSSKFSYFGASFNMMAFLRSYMPLYFVNTVFFSVNLTLQNILVKCGKTWRYLLSLAIGLITRALFEYVLIQKNNLSDKGLFLATLISNSVVLLVLLPIFASKKSDYYLSVKDLKPDFKIIFGVLKCGLTTFIVSCYLAITLTLFILNLKNYDYDLIFGKTNTFYFLLLVVLFSLSGVVIGSHTSKQLAFGVFIFVFTVVLKIVVYCALAFNWLSKLTLAPELLDVVKSLLTEYSSTLTALSIISAANLFYLLLNKKSACFFKIIKIAITFLPIVFIAQPFCLATGIGYSQEVVDFFNGSSFNAHEYFGAHLTTQNGQEGCIFRVFAPNVVRADIMFDTNSWQPMRMERDRNGIHSLFVPGIKEGTAYRFMFITKDYSMLQRIDPFASQVAREKLGYKNTVVYNNAYKFSDDEWMQNRKVDFNKSMNIYELHPGSWKRKPDGSLHTYTELKSELVPYLKENSYNYVEFLPLSESDLYESWGYLPTSPFAASSWYGSPDELKDFINELHKNNIGVLMDFVQYHYNNSNHEVTEFHFSNFDGTELYGFDNDNLKLTIYKSLKFNYNKNWVRSFLFSNLKYWLKEYHFDGVRTDAVHYSMVWNDNEKENFRYSGVKFLKDLNTEIKNKYPDVLLVAEEIMGRENITQPVEKGGMGFDLKWNVGMTHDMLEFLSMSQEERKKNYGQPLFSMEYFYDNKFINTLSHDDASPPIEKVTTNVIGRMYGSHEEQLRQGRLFYMFMYMHPGKKLTFMGSEIGQYLKWNCHSALDWNVLLNEKNAKFFSFMNTLNKFYLKNEVLYKNEFNRNNFSWRSLDKSKDLIYAFERTTNGKKLIAVFNFSDKDYNDFKLELKEKEQVREVLNSDDISFGGNTIRDKSILPIQRTSLGNESIITVPKLSGVVFEVVNEN